MSDVRVDLKNVGPIRLMALDTATFFLPFGRPIADYLGGERGPLRNRGLSPLEFPVALRWMDTVAAGLSANLLGVDADQAALEAVASPREREREREAEPGQAGFLGMTLDSVPACDAGAAGRTLTPFEPPTRSGPVLPEAEARPLRPKFKFAPPPAVPPRPVVASVPSGPGPAMAPKPVASPAAPQAAAPTAKVPELPKPVPVPRPAPAPMARPGGPQPVTRPVPSPAPAQPIGKPAAVPPVSKPAVPPAKPETPKSPSPATRPAAAAITTPAPARPEPAKVEPPKADAPPEPKVEPRPEPRREPPAAAEPKPVETAVPTFGGAAFGPIPDDSGLDDGSRWSTLLKIGIPILALGGVIGYFTLGPGPDSSKPARNSDNQSIAMGEQGWVNEWASDVVGSRRARQLTFYRPSMQRSDYVFEFTGTIESKALGWVFRAQDTKNYYGMKIEIGKPGQLLISRFAVVDGRESSNSSRPLPIVARPDTALTVRVDVSGPRFSVYLQGQPVDVWTDNRLKTGAVGFMNEREERARTSSVRVQVAGPAN